jgi:hypothetical protein
MSRLANKVRNELREAAEHCDVALLRELRCIASVCVHRFANISTRMQTKRPERIDSGAHFFGEHLISQRVSSRRVIRRQSMTGY